MIFLDRNDPQAMAIQKEREERVRRIREQQEEERKKKLEELRQHVSCSRPLDHLDNMREKPILIVKRKVCCC